VELTLEIVHEFVKKIIVHKSEKVDDKRFQQVDIYYSGVDIIREPSPEEMEKYF
jgi:hypothetical protein